MPYIVSKNIKKAYTEASAGAYRGKYYISMKEGQKTELYVYDTALQLWHREDECSIRFPCCAEGRFYFVDAGKRVREIAGDGPEEIPWMIESGDQIESSMEKKRLHRIQVMMELERGAMAEVYIRYDGEPEWKRVHTITAVRKQMFPFSIRPRAYTHYRYRIVGKGGMKLHGIGKVYVQAQKRW